MITLPKAIYYSLKSEDTTSTKKYYKTIHYDLLTINTEEDNGSQAADACRNL